MPIPAPVEIPPPPLVDPVEGDVVLPGAEVAVTSAGARLVAVDVEDEVAEDEELDTALSLMLK